MRIYFVVIISFFLGMLLFSTRSHVVLCNSYMYIVGTLNSDGTISDLAGYTIYVYAYQPPPEIFSYLPPVGTTILSVITSERGYFNITVDVDDISNITDRIVVLASPNPAKGIGWSVLEVKSGTYTLNLTASSLPILPKTQIDTQIDYELRLLNQKLVEEQNALENLTATLETLRLIIYIILLLVISAIISSILVFIRMRGILKAMKIGIQS